MSKHRRVCLASYERDVKAMHKLLLRHDTLFTLARHYDLPADHNIVNVLHQHLVSSTNNTSGIYGLDDTRTLDQIFGCIKIIFEDKCAMYTCLVFELRRWGGRQLLNQVFFDRTGNVK